MSTAQRLREARTRRKVSILALARIAGVSRQTIYDTESGTREPDTRTLRRLAEALQVTVADLVSDEPVEAAS